MSDNPNTSTHKQSVSDLVASLEQMKAAAQETAAAQVAALDKAIAMAQAMPAGVMSEVSGFLNDREEGFKSFMRDHFGA